MPVTPAIPAKLLPLLAAEGPLHVAAAPLWEAVAGGVAPKLGHAPGDLEGLLPACLGAIAAWADAPDARVGRSAIQRWLLGLRQDWSLEELLIVVLHLDRVLRQASWELGLPGPDWTALSTAQARFFEGVGDEAAGGFQGLLAQNHQLRDELAYFQRLAASQEGPSDLKSHLDLAVRETARLLRCEFCAILLPRPDARDVLTIEAAVAPRVLSQALEGMTFPLAENGLIAQVFLTGAPGTTYQPLDDLEITLRRRQTLESLGFSQLLAYPLQLHGRVLGVLVLANRLDDQPWQALEEAWLATVAGQLSATVRLSDLANRHAGGEAELTDAFCALVALVDPLLAAHGDRVGELASEIGGALGLAGSRLAGLRLAGRLAGLGQLALPAPLRRRIGALTPAEAVLWRAHPARAAETLATLPALAALAPAVRHQAERWDGQGHPEALQGDAIPLDARILAVADAYAAALAAAPGAPEAALAGVREEAGSRFDPLVVQALAAALGPLRPAAERQLPPAPAPVRLSELLGALVGVADPAAFYPCLWASLGAELPHDGGAFWRRLPESGGEAWSLEACELPWPVPAAPETGLEAYAGACKVPVAVADLQADPRFRRQDGDARPSWAAALAVPVVAAGAVLGVLTLYRRDPQPFAAHEEAALELAGALLAQALTVKDLRERLDAAAGCDPLTGLVGHRAFAERVQAELRRASRFALPVALVALDLDDFSRYNEANGFALGDEALRAVAETITALRRPAAAVARFEGDCFAVLLPECPAAEALTFADALRLAVSGTPFPARRAGGARLTVSVGVTGAGPGGDYPTARSFLADMRQAVRRARAEGESRLLFFASTANEPV